MQGKEQIRGGNRDELRGKLKKRETYKGEEISKREESRGKIRVKRRRQGKKWKRGRR